MLIRQKAVADRDRVVILDSSGAADIATVTDQDDERILAVSSTDEYAIPISDLKSYVGSSGRIFYVGAEPDYISEMKRLAHLEQSTVLRQITNYTEKPDKVEQKGIALREILSYIAIFILILGLIFK